MNPTRRPFAGRRAPGPLAASLWLLVVMLPACSHPRVEGRAIPAAVRDFRILLPATTIQTGTVTFVVHGRGPSTHEFVLVRTNLPADHLPLRADGLTVNEDSPSLSLVGSLDEVDINRTSTLTVGLRAGDYVIFCNFEGHYLGGMHAALHVDPPPA